MNKKLFTYYIIVAIVVRYSIILLTPSKNNFIDLNIYRDAGQLTFYNINPYNFNDNIKIRELLRTDSVNYNSYVCENQKRWNYYSSSNLPLANILFGTIEYLFHSNISYRYVFAFGDVLLSLIVLVIVLKRIKINFKEDTFYPTFLVKYAKYSPYLIALILSAISPIQILWGIIYPGHKGIGLFLILISIYFSSSSNKILSLYLTPFFLALSVNFIGLGFFVAPYCVDNAIKKENSKKEIISFFLIGLFSTFFCLYKFVPEIFSMMSMRSAPQIKPDHASIWAWVYKITPIYWQYIKYSFIIFFILTNLYVLKRKKMNSIILSISLLLLFTIAYLDSGSMDRINIAITTSIVLIGIGKFIRFFFIMSTVYFFYGLLALVTASLIGNQEIIDGIFCSFFLILYLSFLFKYSNDKKSTLLF
jgi:hypothetical protein